MLQDLTFNPLNCDISVQILFGGLNTFLTHIIWENLRVHSGEKNCDQRGFTLD